ncbi:IS200/IS605 family transposase, partial [Marinomonas sp. 2405UD68-3]|uniref:IS200/IS605 family transposase n=1 Tax=Marinomonas sp. 2405UD68-3 TaxID=3391835 RepID=UPI0039C9B9BE
SHYHCVYDMKYHLVLVTKYRRKCFTSTMLDSLQTSCQSLCDKWEVELIEFGGEADHIHLMLGFNPTLQPSKFINNLKTVTSRRIRKEYKSHLDKFYWKPVLWSRAYCLLTAGGAPLEVLKEYIQNQSRPT